MSHACKKANFIFDGDYSKVIWWTGGYYYILESILKNKNTNLMGE
jgi:hypothetical protein